MSHVPPKDTPLHDLAEVILLQLAVERDAITPDAYESAVQALTVEHAAAARFTQGICALVSAHPQATATAPVATIAGGAQ